MAAMLYVGLWCVYSFTKMQALAGLCRDGKLIGNKELFQLSQGLLVPMAVAFLLPAYVGVIELVKRKNIVAEKMLPVSQTKKTIAKLVSMVWGAGLIYLTVYLGFVVEEFMCRQVLGQWMSDAALYTGFREYLNNSFTSYHILENVGLVAGKGGIGSVFEVLLPSVKCMLLVALLVKAVEDIGKVSGLLLVVTVLVFGITLVLGNDSKWGLAYSEQVFSQTKYLVIETLLIVWECVLYVNWKRLSSSVKKEV